VIDPRFSLIGLAVGFLVGLTGMGGGSLMTPIMILVMGVKPLVAVGTDLAYSAVTRAVGGADHLRRGTVHLRTAYLLAAGSVPATVLGVGVTNAVKRADPAFASTFLLHAIAWALIFVGVVLAAKPALTGAARRGGLSLSENWRDDLQQLGDRKLWVLPLAGAVVGFLVGLTSVGAGTLIIAMLLFLYPRWQSKELVGTDVFHAGVLTAAASLAHLVAGDVNIRMMVSLLIGSLPGVLLGTRLAVGFSERWLRLSMASVLLLSGAKLL
jgi:uncharacterized membrane protein YfcA